MSGPASWASSPGRRRNMQANRSRDTGPELAVRRLLHAKGLRYRVAIRPEPSIPRRADIVFTRRRVAVFIDGCFWHGCPTHGRSAFKHNAAYWSGKISRNRVRDAETTRLLESADWIVLRFWEHEDPTEVATTIAYVVHGSQARGPMMDHLRDHDDVGHAGDSLRTQENRSGQPRHRGALGRSSPNATERGRDVMEH